MPNMQQVFGGVGDIDRMRRVVQQHHFLVNDRTESCSQKWNQNLELQWPSSLLQLRGFSNPIYTYNYY